MKEVRHKVRRLFASPGMRVGIPRETTEGERRVALVPETVGKLAAVGFELVVEQGAGDAASFPDRRTPRPAGAVGDPWDAGRRAKVRKPSADERERLRSGQLLIAFLEPLSDQAGVEALAARGVTAFALESCRGSRARTYGRSLVAGDRRRVQGRASLGG